jgi:uncharacterized protein YjbI with pentapeptide repeats
MDRDEALKLLKGGEEGIRAWNAYRRWHHDRQDLAGAELGGAELEGADLTSADLAGANFVLAYLRGARLTNADLRGANLARANLDGANLEEAVLAEANLSRANLDGDHLAGADLEGVMCSATAFIHVNLSQVRGLDKVEHHGPSSVGMDTLFLSKGQIPEVFLRGCGLAPWEVLSARLYDPELTPPRFADLQCDIFSAWTKGKDMINGCFISYSWNDSKFVKKLHARLVAEGINVWLDKHDMAAGTIQDQVWRAIQLHHVVVLVLSEDSVKSDWVENELDMARQKEKAEGRAVLCPVALDDAWEAKVDASDGPGDPSRPLWRTLTQKLVMDFSPWKTKAFDKVFEKLVRGLRTYYGPKHPPAPGTELEPEEASD